MQGAGRVPRRNTWWVVELGVLMNATLMLLLLLVVPCVRPHLARLALNPCIRHHAPGRSM